eukprot:Tbor_TRINITY_DN5409_c0_g1::TRINITY_DN5409_c0_g1_i2::g.24239::m.24239
MGKSRTIIESVIDISFASKPLRKLSSSRSTLLSQYISNDTYGITSTGDTPKGHTTFTDESGPRIHDDDLSMRSLSDLTLDSMNRTSPSLQEPMYSTTVPSSASVRSANTCNLVSSPLSNTTVSSEYDGDETFRSLYNLTAKGIDHASLKYHLKDMTSAVNHQQLKFEGIRADQKQLSENVENYMDVVQKNKHLQSAEKEEERELLMSGKRAEYPLQSHKDAMPASKLENEIKSNYQELKSDMYKTLKLLGRLTSQVGKFNSQQLATKNSKILGAIYFYRWKRLTYISRTRMMNVTIIAQRYFIKWFIIISNSKKERLLNIEIENKKRLRDIFRGWISIVNKYKRLRNVSEILESYSVAHFMSYILKKWFSVSLRRNLGTKKCNMLMNKNTTALRIYYFEKWWLVLCASKKHRQTRQMQIVGMIAKRRIIRNVRRLFSFWRMIGVYRLEAQQDFAAFELRNFQIYGKMVMLRWLKFVDYCKFERKMMRTAGTLNRKFQDSNIDIYELKEDIQELFERQKHLEETVTRITNEKVSISDERTSVLNENKSDDKHQLSTQVKSPLTDILAEGTFDQYLRPKDSSLSHPVVHSRTITRSPSERSNTNLNIQNLFTSSNATPQRPDVVYRPLLREAVIECPLKSPSTNVSIGRRFTSYITQHEKQDSNNPNSSPFDLQKRGQLFRSPSALHQGKRQQGIEQSPGSGKSFRLTASARKKVYSSTPIISSIKVRHGSAVR